MNSLLSVASHAHATLPLDILAGLTLLSLTPFIFVMFTSFVRIVVVLSLVRSAIGASALPPNTVLTGAPSYSRWSSWPTITQISHDAIDPYSQGHISQSQLVDRAARPLRACMLRQARMKDIVLFSHVARQQVMRAAECAHIRLAPGLRRRRITHCVCDRCRALSSIRRNRFGGRLHPHGPGHVHASPPVLSLPAKLLLFVMDDGALVCGGVVSSFR